MKKVISFLTLTLMLVLSTIILSAKTAPNKLYVHYFRYFGASETHTAWVWQYAPASGEGSDITFSQDELLADRWLSFEVELDTDFDGKYKGSTIIGIIIKQGSGWSGPRQPGGDRFIDLSKADTGNGEAHVYFVQEDANVYYSLEDADTSDRVLDAFFETNESITVSATQIPSKTNLYANGVKVGTYDNAQTHTFNFKPEAFDLSQNYDIELEFTNSTSSQYRVSFRKLYDTPAYEEAFHYDGELGLIYTKEKTIFRLWSPVSDDVNLLLYEQGHPHFDSQGNAKDDLTPISKHAMQALDKGVWEIEINEDLEGQYYTFEVTHNNQTFEIVDPYAYSTGANGLRALVIDFAKTNPKKWEYNSRPDTINNMTDYIIYELHVRDLTTHESWGGNPDYAGTFKGVAQPNTSYTTDDGLTVTTGLDHLSELGINAVHFLPIFDFGYVDETRLDDEEYVLVDGFNWGYMPYNFNTPEGSFSTNPFDGYTRVSELKEMILSLHNRNIRVIMDVVYNHTGETEGSQFEKSMPGYYFRQSDDGSFSNGSGTGNETASERSMFRKYMIDSILFWAKEYNISGFRFDLMALHDVETMNEIRTAVNEVDPTIILYGEPWMGGSSPLDSNQQANKDNMDKLNGVASFNDNTRDAVKKQWNKGNTDAEVLESIRYGVAGGVAVDYASADGGTKTYHYEPEKIVNYVSAHDDETLRDWNYLHNSKNPEVLQAMQKQSNAFVLTSQGIPFLHAGVDFMRSKPVPAAWEIEGGDNRVVQNLAGNSYNMPDVVNQLNWEKKAEHYDVYNFYRHLIALRRISPNLRLSSADEVNEKLVFEKTNDSNLIAYRYLGDENTPEIVVVHANKSFGSYTPDKDYISITDIEGNLDAHGISKVKSGTAINILNYNTLILVEDNGMFNYSPGAKPYTFYTESSDVNLGVILAISITIVVIGLGGAIGYIIYKRQPQD